MGKRRLRGLLGCQALEEEIHTSLSFLKVIGRHVQSSGLLEAWIESELLGQKQQNMFLKASRMKRE